MGNVNNQRRYYLLRANYYGQFYEEAIWQQVWWGKQDLVAGTALPVTVPFQDVLAVAHYSMVEDLTGADLNELMTAGLTLQQATAVLESLGFPVC